MSAGSYAAVGVGVAPPRLHLCSKSPAKALSLNQKNAGKSLWGLLIPAR